MKCKSCKAELDPHNPICPDCGFDNTKQQMNNKSKILVIVAALVIGLVVGIMVALVVVGMNANGGNTETTDPSTEETVSAEFLAAMDDVIAVIGDRELTNGELQLYYWMAAYNDTGDADLTLDLSKQIYDDETGESYQEYFLSVAIEGWKEITLMANAARDAGFDMPESYQPQFESLEEDMASTGARYYGFSSADELVQLNFGPGCDFEDYYNYLWDYYLGYLYWSEMLTELDATDAEIEAYFTENEESLLTDYSVPVTKDYGNLVDLRNILVSVVTNEQVDDEGVVTYTEDWDATLTKAQQIYDQLMAGELTPESFDALGAQYAEEDETIINGGLYTDMYKGVLSEVDVRHILICPEEDTEAGWEEALAGCTAVYEEWLAGEATEESFAQLANSYSHDNNGKVTNGGLYEDVYIGQMVETFEDWCFDSSRKTGDIEIIATEYGYHLMYFVRADNELDNWCFDAERTAGDCAMLKTDYGYQIILIEDSEAAWIRYCRYGVQAEKASAMLDEMMEQTTFDVDKDSIVLGDVN